MARAIQQRRSTHRTPVGGRLARLASFGGEAHVKHVGVAKRTTARCEGGGHLLAVPWSQKSLASSYSVGWSAPRSQTASGGV